MVDDQRNIAQQISAQQNVFTHAQTLSSFTKQDKGRRFYAEVPDILLNDEKALFATQALLSDAISTLKRPEEAPAPSIELGRREDMTVLQFNDIPVLNYDSGSTGFPKYAVSAILSKRQQRMARSWEKQDHTYYTEDPLLIEIAKTLFPEKYENCTISLQASAEEYQTLKQTIGISDPFRDLRGS